MPSKLVKMLNTGQITEEDINSLFEDQHFRRFYNFYYEKLIKDGLSDNAAFENAVLEALEKYKELIISQSTLSQQQIRTQHSVNTPACEFKKGWVAGSVFDSVLGPFIFF